MKAVAGLLQLLPTAAMPQSQVVAVRGVIATGHASCRTEPASEGDNAVARASDHHIVQIPVHSISVSVRTTDACEDGGRTFSHIAAVESGQLPIPLLCFSLSLFVA